MWQTTKLFTLKYSKITGTRLISAKSLLASKGISVDLEEDISEHLEHPVEECIDSKVTRTPSQSIPNPVLHTYKLKEI